MGLSPKDMENAIIKNLPEKTGKSIDEWIKFLVVNKSHADKKEIKIYLKEKHKIGHFQAQTIVKYFFEQKTK
ncbi:MAG: DUF4287 domain-containing protein [Saprospiraceae bacterium]|nr:DUF4287 domain-containing protein [Saprospiraceae bacterium]